MKKRFKKNLNLILGTIIFLFLIGGAFAVDWIFGVGFFIGFLISVYNGLAERNPLIPLFLFVGALIIRIGISFIPSVIEAEDLISLIFSLALFLILIITGLMLQKGKWKIWKFSFMNFFKKLTSKKRRLKQKAKKILKKTI